MFPMTLLVHVNRCLRAFLVNIYRLSCFCFVDSKHVLLVCVFFAALNRSILVLVGFNSFLNVLVCLNRVLIVVCAFV